jgi:(p)ppGpp synthase/HD superfamily hydrolase
MDSKIIAFAIQAHASVNQEYDGLPYSVHLSMVFSQAMKFIEFIPKKDRNNVLNAVWLHDTIEDCRLTYNDIVKISNVEVAEMVYALSNEKGRNRKERANGKYYKGIRETEFATFIKLCDRLANVIYSRDTKSRMFDVYKDENEKFLKSLFPTPDQELRYRELVKELRDSFILVRAIPPMFAQVDTNIPFIDD